MGFFWGIEECCEIVRRYFILVNESVLVSKLIIVFVEYYNPLLKLITMEIGRLHPKEFLPAVERGLTGDVKN